MPTRGKPVVILLVVIAILLGLIFWRLSDKKTVAPTPNSTDNTGAVSTPTPSTWEDRTQALRTVFTGLFPDIKIEERSPISVEEESDVTGDGKPEALVNLGSGGASVDYVAIARFEGNTPVAAKFKLADGRVEPMMFIQGGSVMHADAVFLVPADHLVYSGTLLNDSETGGIASCEVSAYVWNSTTKLFEYNKSKSNTLKPQFCLQN